MKITLTKREQEQYDKLSDPKAQDNYMKAVELRRKADTLQRENRVLERKKDTHDKIVLGGIIVKVFGKLNEAQRKVLLKELQEEKLYNSLKAKLDELSDNEEKGD